MIAKLGKSLDASRKTHVPRGGGVDGGQRRLDASVAAAQVTRERVAVQDTWPKAPAKTR